MTDDWSLLESVTVLSNHRTNLVEQLSKISFEHPIEGECVKWHIDENQNIAVISDSSFENESCIELKNTTVMEPGGQIRPPKSVREEVKGKIRPGDTVYYLASKGMIDEAPYSCFLLTKKAVFGALNGSDDIKRI